MHHLMQYIVVLFVILISIIAVGVMSFIAFIYLYILSIWIFKRSHYKHDYWCHTDNIQPEHAHGHSEPHV